MQASFIDSAEDGVPVENPESCPVCKGSLGTDWQVLECGHSYCLDCMRALMEHMGRPSCIVEQGAGLARVDVRVGSHRYIKCPVCRTQSPLGSIMLVRLSKPKIAKAAACAGAADVAATAPAADEPATCGAKEGPATSVEESSTSGKWSVPATSGEGTAASGEGEGVSELEESVVNVVGDHSSKLFELLKCLLTIRRKQPAAKILIFSAVSLSSLLLFI